MNYGKLEKEIVAQLSEVFMPLGWIVEAMPQSDAELQRAISPTRPIITVSYISSEISPISTDGRVQNETMTYGILCRASFLREQSGIYDIIAAVKRRLLGFKTKVSGPFSLNKVSIEDTQGGNYWMFLVLVKATTMLTADPDNTKFPELAEVKFETEINTAGL